MLRNDLIHHHSGQISKPNLAKIKADFQANSFELLSEDDSKQVFNIK